MPLHTTGLVSRYQLDHPNEKPRESEPALPYERVLKYNPNHDKSTGRFTSGSGGGGGGSMAETYRKMRAGEGGLGYSKPSPIGGGFVSRRSLAESAFAKGGPQVVDPRFHKGPAASRDPNFHRGEGDAELAGSQPYPHTSGYRYPTGHSQSGQFKLPTTYPGSMKGKTPTKRSSFS